MKWTIKPGKIFFLCVCGGAYAHTTVPSPSASNSIPISMLLYDRTYTQWDIYSYSARTLKLSVMITPHNVIMDMQAHFAWANANVSIIQKSMSSLIENGFKQESISIL